jgi:hypothetical protein
MMQARTKFDEEALRALGEEGTKVCRELPIGIGAHDWVRGTVVAVSEGKVGIRIDDLGRYPHAIGGAPVQRGDVVWDAPAFWTPCL